MNEEKVKETPYEKHKMLFVDSLGFMLLQKVGVQASTTSRPKRPKKHKWTSKLLEKIKALLGPHEDFSVQGSR